MSTASQSYRLIDTKLLDSTADLVFDIYYKSEGYGETRFVKFASKDPAHRAKVRQLLESDELMEDLYIHEDDMVRYFENATNTLRSFVDDPKISVEKKLAKVYDVSKDTTQQFFEVNANPEILRVSGQVVELMDNCLSQKGFGFYGLSKIVSKDYYTYTHSINVGLYCMTFGLKVGLLPAEVQELGLGGMLHDVGKAKIPHKIIRKDGKLTTEEFENMKTHTKLGEDIIRELGCYGTKVIEMVGQHHEKFNGGGYHQGLEKDDIPYFAKICKITDVYDALTTRRSYKKALPPITALTLMKKEMFEEFDPKLLLMFISMMGPE